MMSIIKSRWIWRKEEISRGMKRGVLFEHHNDKDQNLPIKIQYYMYYKKNLVKRMNQWNIWQTVAFSFKLTSLNHILFGELQWFHISYNWWFYLVYTQWLEWIWWLANQWMVQWIQLQHLNYVWTMDWIQQTWTEDKK